MRVTRAIGLKRAGACLLWGLAALVGSTASHAALSRPDAMCYGKVAINGQAVPGSIVSARIGDLVLGSYMVGSHPAAPMFYGVSIPLAQATDGGEVLPPLTPADGSVVQLFVNERLAGEFAVHSGAIARRDLSGGQTLCSGGAKDGEACTIDSNCPGGFCVVARALCDGGGNDGDECHCIGGSCSAAGSCTTNAAMGTCTGGVVAGECCAPASNCPGGTCAGTQKLCQGGSRSGAPCINNSHCPGSTCVSPTMICVGGSQSGYSCIDSGDCPGGDCGLRVSTPTPGGVSTPTRTGGVSGSPTPTRTPATGCAGDCDGSDSVAINELIKLVNIALGTTAASECAAGDSNGDGMISISELVAAVNRALNGCG